MLIDYNTDWKKVVEKLNTINGVKAWISVSTLYISSKLYSDGNDTNSFSFNIWNMTDEHKENLRWFLFGLTLHCPLWHSED